MLNAITNPPSAKPSMAYDKALMSPKYSGVRKRQLRPYFAAKLLEVNANKTIQKNKNK